MTSRPTDRPFRTATELQMERALAAQYREIGNAALVAALMLIRQAPDQPLPERQAA